MKFTDNCPDIQQTKKVLIFVFDRFDLTASVFRQQQNFCNSPIKQITPVLTRLVNLVLNVKRPVPVTPQRKQSTGAESVDGLCKYSSVEQHTHCLLLSSLQA